MRLTVIRQQVTGRVCVVLGMRDDELAAVVARTNVLQFNVGALLTESAQSIGLTEAEQLGGDYDMILLAGDAEQDLVRALSAIGRIVKHEHNA